MKIKNLTSLFFALIICMSAAAFVFMNAQTVGSDVIESVELTVPQAHVAKRGGEIEIMKSFFVLVQKFLPAS